MVQRFTDDFKNIKVASNIRNVIQSFCNKMKTRLLKSSPHSIVKKCYFDVKVSFWKRTGGGLDMRFFRDNCNNY